MTTIYLVMEYVDLGGNPVMAFECEKDAELFTVKQNADWRVNKVKSLLRLPHYDMAKAEAWCATQNDQFYIEEVEMVDGTDNVENLCRAAQREAFEDAIDFILHKHYDDPYCLAEKIREMAKEKQNADR